MAPVVSPIYIPVHSLVGVCNIHILYMILSRGKCIHTCAVSISIVSVAPFTDTSVIPFSVHALRIDINFITVVVIITLTFINICGKH